MKAKETIYGKHVVSESGIVVFYLFFFIILFSHTCVTIKIPQSIAAAMAFSRFHTLVVLGTKSQRIDDHEKSERHFFSAIKEKAFIFENMFRVQLQSRISCDAKKEHFPGGEIWVRNKSSNFLFFSLRQKEIEHFLIQRLRENDNNAAFTYWTNACVTNGNIISLSLVGTLTHLLYLLDLVGTYASTTKVIILFLILRCMRY